jgi:Mg2+/citrate symporter
MNAPRLRVLLVGAGGVIGRCVHQAIANDCTVITAGLDDAQHRVDLADFHKKVIWRAVICALVMLGVAIILGVVPTG